MLARLRGIEVVPVGEAVLHRIAVGDVVCDKVDGDGQQENDHSYAEKRERASLFDLVIQFDVADLFHLFSSVGS